jgi:hypothetical protein
MESRLTYGELDQVVDHVNFKDQVARFPHAPVPNPDSFNGRALAAAEKARQERRRAMDEKNARRLATVQADADAARHELAGLARKVARRDAERQRVEREAHELINKGRALLDRDQREHAEFDNRVLDLKARAAALPPRKERP